MAVVALKDRPESRKPAGLGALPGAFVGSMLRRAAYHDQYRRALAEPNHWAMPDPDEQKFVAVAYHLSFVPDVIYPFDAAMVGRIRREFDPVFTPIFRKLVYRSDTGGTLIFVNHGLARYQEEIRTDPKVMQAHRPRYGFPRQVPNYIERWFEEPYVLGSWRHLHSLPKQFRPWTDTMFAWARRTFWAASAKEKWRALAEGDEEHEQRKVDHWEKENREAEYRGRNELREQRRLIDSMGPADERAAIGIMAGMERPTKCTIHYGRSIRETMKARKKTA